MKKIQVSPTSLGVDLSPAIANWSSSQGEQLDQWDWDALPDDQLFDLINPHVPGVISKGADTPFRVYADDTFDQDVVEVEIAFNFGYKEDGFSSGLTPEEWLERWGDRFEIIPALGTNYLEVIIPETNRVNRLRLTLGRDAVFVSGSHKDAGNIERKLCTGSLPLESVQIKRSLLDLKLVGLNRGDWQPEAVPEATQERLRQECDRWNATEWQALKGTYADYHCDTLNDRDERVTTSERFEHIWWADPTGFFRGKSTHRGCAWKVFFDQPKRRDAAVEIAALTPYPVQHWIDRYLPLLVEQWQLEKVDTRPAHEKICDAFRHHKLEVGDVKYITAVQPHYRDYNPNWCWQVATWENKPGWHKSRPIHTHCEIEFYDGLVEDEYERYRTSLEKAWEQAIVWTPQLQIEKEAADKTARDTAAAATKAEMEALAAAARAAGYTVLYKENLGGYEPYKWSVEGSYHINGYGRKGHRKRNPPLDVFCKHFKIEPNDPEVEAAIAAIDTRSTQPFTLSGKQGALFVRKLYQSGNAWEFEADCGVMWNGRTLTLSPARQTGLLIGKNGCHVKATSDRWQIPIKIKSLDATQLEVLD